MKTVANFNEMQSPQPHPRPARTHTLGFKPAGDLSGALNRARTAADFAPAHGRDACGMCAVGHDGF